MRLFQQIAIIFFLPCVAWGQLTYHVEGKIGHLNAPATIFLSFRQGEAWQRKTDTLKDGRFSFQGTMSQAVAASIVVIYADPVSHQTIPLMENRLDFYLDTAAITITSADSLHHSHVSGSDLTLQYQRLMALLQPLRRQRKRIIAVYNGQNHTGEGNYPADVSRQLDSIRGLERTVLRSYITQNPNSLMSLEALDMYKTGMPDVKEIEPLFRSLSDAVRASRKATEFAALIDNLKNVQPGSKAPEIVQKNPQGKTISLSDFRGRYVLVDFWASWCVPCRKENPALVKAYNKYGGEHFMILGVSLDTRQTFNDWLKAIQEDHLTWEQVSDPDGSTNKAAVDYSIKGIPQNFLIDPSGTIVARNLHGEELLAALGKLNL